MRHLKAFHVFHIAASSATFSEAAEKLNITHGAVSKQIKVLESYLSQPLFFKKGRNVYLTQQGELLKSYTDQAFQVLDTGIQKVLREKSTHLEVSCEPTLTMRWLMPRLANFYESSGIDIRLSTAGGPVALGSSGLSMAIRRDDFEIPALYKSTVLVDEWVGPVFSPDYWQQVKNDLSQVKLLHSQTRPEAWEYWLSHVTSLNILGAAQQTFGHFYFCLQAAVDGLGAAIGSYPLVVDDLSRGHLVAPFGFIPSGHSYVLIAQDKGPDESEHPFSCWLKENLIGCEPKSKEKLNVINRSGS